MNDEIARRRQTMHDEVAARLARDVRESERQAQIKNEELASLWREEQQRADALLARLRAANAERLLLEYARDVLHWKGRIVSGSLTGYEAQKFGSAFIALHLPIPTAKRVVDAPAVTEWNREIGQNSRHTVVRRERSHWERGTFDNIVRFEAFEQDSTNYVRIHEYDEYDEDMLCRQRGGYVPLDTPQVQADMREALISFGISHAENFAAYVQSGEATRREHSLRGLFDRMLGS